MPLPVPVRFLTTPAVRATTTTSRPFLNVRTPARTLSVGGPRPPAHRSPSAEPQCPQGDAYKDYQGNYYVCSNSGTGNSCPVNYECYFDGYVWGCCPTKAYTCTLSPHKGVTCGSGSSYRYSVLSSRNRLPSLDISTTPRPRNARASNTTAAMETATTSPPARIVRATVEWEDAPTVVHRRGTSSAS